MGASKKNLILVLSVLLIALIFMTALLIMEDVGRKGKDASARLYADSIRRAALTCYAVEGRYPMDLDYLIENYGVVAEHGDLTVRYDAFASNVMPDIAVFRTEGGAE